jgi:hypothetical protein
MSTMTAQGGDWYGLPLTKAGGSIRFLVVDPITGNRSSTWMVKTAKKRDDVYLMERTTSGHWKASHHNDDQLWRIAMTKEASVELETKRVVFDEWPRPAPTMGWSEGVSVLVPCAYLRSSSAPVKDSVLKIPTSTFHSAICVSVLLEEDRAEVIRELPAAHPVARLARCNGGAVYVIAEPLSLGLEQHESLAEMRSDARRQFPAEAESPGRFVGVLRIDDRRLLVDLCVG